MNRRNVKKWFFSLQIYLLISMAFWCSHADVYASVEHLSVQGTFLVNEKGEKVVLRGVSLGWHNWWPRFYNASAIKTLKEEWHCTLVRAAMGVEPEGAYWADRKKALACVTTVADAAIANDMYIIIDWHSHGIHTKDAVAFFKEMTLRYKGIPNVIYEIFNEPVDNSWEEVKAYAEEVIDCIRSIDSEALILVGSPHWDQDIHLAADNPLADARNVMYTLHFYAASHKEFLRERAGYALKKGCQFLFRNVPGWRQVETEKLTKKNGING